MAPGPGPPSTLSGTGTSGWDQGLWLIGGWIGGGSWGSLSSPFDWGFLVIGDREALEQSEAAEQVEQHEACNLVEQEEQDQGVKHGKLSETGKPYEVENLAGQEDGAEVGERQSDWLIEAHHQQQVNEPYIEVKRDQDNKVICYFRASETCPNKKRTFEKQMDMV
ncbi:hypothetical protein GOP47_0020080 [Adiantum capillus-veneris]|uniref:Uncharacterized protein n=1 Tax=Adiantum capillus-veneris TaxID=13818 RepID=A0A9D4UCR5_ADICA|nr:hypothetical protein GOP47_0020080 [Adiantum capillus-veneris]